MRAISILLFIFVCAFPLVAQPGYQGKKLTVSYNFAFSPAISYPTYKGAQGIGAFNTIHSARIDRVLSRRGSLGFIWNYSRTSIDYSLYVYSDDIYSSLNNPMKIHTNAFGITYRLYSGKPGNLAPIGRYTEFQGFVVDNLIHDKLFDQDVLRFKRVMFALSVGKQKVWFNRLLFDYGIRVSFDPMTLLVDGIEILGNSPDLQGQAGMRVFSQQLVNFRLGLGLLAK